jgi:hypothetical protein
VGPNHRSDRVPIKTTSLTRWHTCVGRVPISFPTISPIAEVAHKQPSPGTLTPNAATSSILSKLRRYEGRIATVWAIRSVLGLPPPGPS